MKDLRQAAALPGSRRVTAIAAVQVHEQDGVAGAGAQLVDFRKWKIGPEVHIRVDRPVVVLEVVDNRAIAIELAKKGAGQEAGMGYDDVGLDVGTSAQGVVDGVAVPDGVLKRSAAVMVLLRGSA